MTKIRRKEGQEGTESIRGTHTGFPNQVIQEILSTTFGTGRTEVKKNRYGSFSLKDKYRWPM